MSNNIINQLRKLIRAQIIEAKAKKAKKKLAEGLNDNDPVAFSSPAGSVMCADCHGLAKGEDEPIFAWDQFEATCDGCGKAIHADGSMRHGLEEGEIVGDEYLPDDEEFETEPGDDDMASYFPSEDEYSVGGPPALPRKPVSTIPPPLPGSREAVEEAKKAKAKKGAKKKPGKSSKKPVKEGPDSWTSSTSIDMGGTSERRPGWKAADGSDDEEYVDDFNPGMETPHLNQLVDRLKAWHGAPLDATSLERLMEVEELAATLLSKLSKR